MRPSFSKFSKSCGGIHLCLEYQIRLQNSGTPLSSELRKRCWDLISEYVELTFLTNKSHTYPASVFHSSGRHHVRHVTHWSPFLADTDMNMRSWTSLFACSGPNRNTYNLLSLLGSWEEILLLDWLSTWPRFGVCLDLPACFSNVYSCMVLCAMHFGPSPFNQDWFVALRQSFDRFNKSANWQWNNRNKARSCTWVTLKHISIRKITEPIFLLSPLGSQNDSSSRTSADVFWMTDFSCKMQEIRH